MMISGGVVPGGNWRTVGLRDGGDLRESGLDVGRRLEEDLDDGAAVHGLRLRVFDIVHSRGQAALVLLTMRSAISCADRPWKCQMMLMTGILISGRISTGVRDNHDRAKYEYEQRHHHEGVWTPQRQTYYPHLPGPLK